MLEINVTGQVRSDLGKKASKDIRKQGLIPCNIYGVKRGGEKNLPVALSFTSSFAELRKAIYTPHVYVVNLNIDGVDHKAVIKELQFHPVTDALLHVDFLEITEDKPVTVGIPVELKGLANGVRNGGRLALLVRQIKVTAVYTNIPEKLVIDVTNLELGKSIKVGDLNFEGLEFATPKEVNVCSVQMTRAARAAAQAAQ
ncbi:50S ribosomal protein L25/general stress protein Ctc [Palleniella muris]|jgi:ribosomal protein L25, Ctc-form|uniref:50S ribosomal protein L25/general stress protein Ctc n=1 Tax=Palleniella muris TaxID=3038145 RepID=A0AC61QRZ1_9BACT|nr:MULTISPECIES: 50S ribosomal protein L25/general stress protein Ctc [Palleniella]NPD81295.1 50S ribosomal protein L25/general stress protein Ctc [Palleniella intestinalis]TGX83050.1 50S ribosomal protein L25/general stress protein Ctc [Palleniella muris]